MFMKWMKVYKKQTLPQKNNSKINQSWSVLVSALVSSFDIIVLHFRLYLLQYLKSFRPGNRPLKHTHLFLTYISDRTKRDNNGEMSI